MRAEIALAQAHKRPIVCILPVGVRMDELLAVANKTLDVLEVKARTDVYFAPNNGLEDAAKALLDEVRKECRRPLDEEPPPSHCIPARNGRRDVSHLLIACTPVPAHRSRCEWLARSLHARCDGLRVNLLGSDAAVAVESATRARHVLVLLTTDAIDEAGTPTLLAAAAALTRNALTIAFLSIEDRRTLRGMSGGGAAAAESVLKKAKEPLLTWPLLGTLEERGPRESIFERLFHTIGAVPVSRAWSRIGVSAAGLARVLRASGADALFPSGAHHVTLFQFYEKAREDARKKKRKGEALLLSCGYFCEPELSDSSVFVSCPWSATVEDLLRMLEAADARGGVPAFYWMESLSVAYDSSEFVELKQAMAREVACVGGSAVLNEQRVKADIFSNSWRNSIEHQRGWLGPWAFSRRWLLAEVATAVNAGRSIDFEPMLSVRGSAIDFCSLLQVASDFARHPRAASTAWGRLGTFSRRLCASLRHPRVVWPRASRRGYVWA